MKEMKLDRHEFHLLVNDILLDVKPVKLRIRIANRLIEFFDKKQERISELEEQLKNANVPKFNYHQVIYVLCNDEIIKGQIDCFDYYNKKYLIYLMGFGLGNEWCYEYEVFATKEEAESKLKELRGE